MIIYILTILLFAISFITKIRDYKRLRILDDKLKDFKFTNSILLIWIVLGFFTRLDFSQMMGDIIYGEKIFDYNNIGFSSISFLFILIARLLKNYKGKIIILLIELSIWLIRFYYYKGGYAMGFTANYPLDLIVLYDTIALFIRLKQIDNIKRISFLQTRRIYLIVIFLISIKIFIFPTPHEMFWETKRIQKKKDYVKSMLIGDWSGSIQYDSVWFDTLAIYRLDTIPDNLNVFHITGADRTHNDSTHKYALKEMNKTIIDSAKILIKNNIIASPMSPDCEMDFNYFDWGKLICNETIDYGNFKIWKIDRDSLIITITEGFERKYKYKLKKNNAW